MPAPALAVVRAVVVAAVAGALMVAPAPAPAAAQQADPLRGQWPMETSGDAVPDVSGHGHAGSASGTGEIPGRFGKAMSFLDPASSRVTVPDSPALEPQRLTLMAWVRRLQNSAPPGTYQTVVGKGSNSGCSRASYALYTGASGGLQFYVAQDAPVAGSVTFSPDAGTGLWTDDQTWHAVAGTYDGARVRLYVDGVEVGSGSAASATIPYNLGAGTLDALTLGAYANQSCGPQFTFGAGVDDVRLYDRALSAAEIARLQTATGPEPPVLVPDGGGTPAPTPTVPAPTPTPMVPAPTPTPTPPPDPVAVTGIATAGGVASAHEPVTLVASATGPVTEYRWDLTGDGKADLTCGADQPAARFRATGAAALRPTVTVAGAGGATARLTQAVALAPVSLKGAEKALADALRAEPVTACGAAPTLGGHQALAALRNTSCVASTTVHAGILATQGCLRPLTSLDAIPAAERAIVDRLRGTVQRYIGSGQFIEAQRIVDLTDAYIAAGPVRVNGVDITPVGGAQIIVYPQIHAVVSSNARVTVGGIALDTPRDFILDTHTVGGRIPIGSFARLPGILKAIGSFPLGGNVDVSLDNGGATITVRLKLPAWMDFSGGPGLGEVRMRATLDDGLVLDALRIGPLDVSLGSLGVTDFQIDYSRAAAEWRGQGRACVIPGLGCLTMVPPNGGVIIRHGSLYEAGASLELSPGIIVFPGVTLQRFGFKVGLDPTRVGGNVKLNALGIIGIEGRLILAFPSPATPYIPTPDDVGRSFPADIYTIPFTTPTFAAGGDVSLDVPLVGSTRIGGGYFLYSFPGKVAFGGGVNISVLDVISVEGGVDGRFNFENGRFNLAGHIRACIADVICAGAVANLSSRGVGGCVELGPLNVGGGVQWDGPTIKLWPFDGCKWSRFAESDVFGVASAAEAGAPLKVKVAKGDRSTAIELDGAGGAPRVRVTGPGGTDAVSTGVAGLTTTARARIMRSETLKRTVVGLVDPVPGTYVITPLEGSPAIAKVLKAEDQPPAKATAVVRGAGTTRYLTYDVARRPDQVVTFVEHSAQGPREIGRVAGGGRGTLRFTTAPGRGTRTVQAQFELAGLAAETLTIARFTPPSPRLGRPRAVTVRRSGSALRVSWAAVPEATRYELVTTLGDGTQRLVRTGARRATVRGVARTLGGTVRVRAADAVRQGPSRTARFRGHGTAKTRFGPLRPAKRAVR
ncbi:hypothetical protein DSM104299_00133 [Baekduia alba]|uniref:LamG domain-containing protein n=1 Tax=Baekduia alba TaxID=2997333 RepID=UPI0023411415|nr:LamG domain-containing protein [Baekduia alba]WCB91462.1 hypothetical protein DSM104299_00133 [Baekduia alba]